MKILLAFAALAALLAFAQVIGENCQKPTNKYDRSGYTVHTCGI